MPSLVGQQPIFESIDGGFTQTFFEQPASNAEADLDLKYTIALAYPHNISLYQLGDAWIQADMDGRT
jgi:tripeptidyl-peptidase-1